MLLLNRKLWQKAWILNQIRAKDDQKIELNKRNIENNCSQIPCLYWRYMNLCVRGNPFKDSPPIRQAPDWLLLNVTLRPDWAQLQTEGSSLKSRLNQGLHCWLRNSVAVEKPRRHPKQPLPWTAWANGIEVTLLKIETCRFQYVSKHWPT